MFDIALRSDGGTAVAVPQVRGRHHAFVQDTQGAVFAHFEFIAHHGHFRIEIGAGDARMGHAIGFHFERPLEVFFLLQSFEVVGAVVIRGSVVAATAALDQFADLVQLVGALEQHVLQQMRHAGFAVAFVPGADQIGDCDGERRLGGIGKQQHLEPVVETIFGNPLDRRDFRLCGANPGERSRQDGDGRKSSFHLIFSLYHLVET